MTSNGPSAARARGAGGRFVAATANPKAATPKAATPKAATPRPRSAPAKPKPTTARPKPAAAKPKVAAAKPKVAAAKPKVATAKPKATAAKPKAAAPALTSAPVATQPTAQVFDLYLLRHADAGDSAAWTGDDALRPLSKKGRRQSRRLGKHLAGLGIEVQAILTSPRLRAADTAKLVGKALSVKPTVDARLDTGFDRAGLKAVLEGLEATASAVVLVGHDPDFSALASWLSDSTVEMRKGAIAKLELPTRAVGAGAGALRWLLPPDAVRG